MDDDHEHSEAEAASIARATTLTLTHAVEVFAAARGGRAPLVQQTESELAQLLHDGLSEPAELIFHTFSWHGDYNIMLAPDDEGIRVDLCEREEGSVIKAGPLAGKRMSIPRPFSEDE